MKNNLTNRENRVFIIYQYYLLNLNYNHVTKEINNIFYKFTSEEEQTILNIIEKISQLEEIIKSFLKQGWSWERINPLEKAILINGAAELKIYKNKKEVVINESVEITKKYCDEKAKGLINALLDKVSKENN